MPTTTHAYVGRSIPRVEDRRLLTGDSRFGADFDQPGQLHARAAVHAHEAIIGTATPESQALEHLVANTYTRMEARDLELNAYLNA